MKISIDLTYHCECPGCEAFFRARAPLQAVLDEVPVVPELPPGWVLEDIQEATPWGYGDVEVQLLCPKHRSDADTTVIDNRIVPSPEIVTRARRLQALAMDPRTPAKEQDNAWAAFEKLWAKYQLPEDLGIERR